MPAQMKVERGNFLVAKNINVEPGVKTGLDVIHIFLEDTAGVLHQVAFAARSFHIKGVVKAFHRMAPVRPEKEAAEDELVKLTRRPAHLGSGAVTACRVCGCTDIDCSGCIEKTGEPCHWVADPEGGNLCSRCAADITSPGGGHAAGTGIRVDSEDRPGVDQADGQAHKVGT